MKAIWIVRWQELALRIRFRTAIVGYDPRDRTLRNYIYLLYVLIFFSIWGFAVLTLLADAGSAVLSLVSGFSPSMAAVMLLAGLLLLLAVIQAYRAGVRSPFLFSDTDAELICQTPVDRSQVALAWFLGDWVVGGLLYSALAVVMRFASLQMMIPGGFTWPLLPRFLLAGVQTTCIVLPLNMVFSALAYVIGASRLQGGVENRWIRWVPVGFGVMLVVFVFGGMPPARILLWPVLFPIEAVFGVTRWLPGFIVALVFACLGLFALYWSGRALNLSRAAQESRSRWASRQAALLGDDKLSQVLKVRKKLGLGHSQSLIPAGEGFYSIIWKEGVRATRLVGFGSLITWSTIFGLSLAMLLASDWGTRLWAFVVWGLLGGQRGTAGLREDIAIWNLTRQLPFSARRLLMAECIAPASVILLFSWIALGISVLITYKIPLFLVFLFPTAIMAFVFSAAYDFLRQCRTSELLVGHVAEPGVGGLLIGLVLAGLPIYLIFSLTSLSSSPGVAVLVTLLGFLLGAGAAYAIWRLAALAYRNIR
jgi:hypothetical protein